jgi:hypothetical protein
MKKCFCLLLLSILICGIMPGFGQTRFAFSRSVVGYVKDRENHPVGGAQGLRLSEWRDGGENRLRSVEERR